MLLASGQTNVLHIYHLWEALYFQGTAVDLKQLINTQRQQAFSSGPDTDYRCHETRNLITSTLSFDTVSCLQSIANTWCDTFAHQVCPEMVIVVRMRALEALVWENVRSQL